MYLDLKLFIRVRNGAAGHLAAAQNGKLSNYKIARGKKKQKTHIKIKNIESFTLHFNLQVFVYKTPPLFYILLFISLVL